MRRSSTRSFVVALTTAAGVTGACGGDYGSDTAPVANDGGLCTANLADDVANCGVCGKACGGNEYCDHGACTPGCAGRVVYVAMGGNDLNVGCERGAPKRTLGSAIAAVKALGATGHEIRICKGSYEEARLTLDYPVSLRGGYECSVWTRSPSYGHPTYDPSNETIVLNGDYVSSPTTLSVRGAAITRSNTTIDGLVVRGASDGGSGSSAVTVSDGASPTITSVRIIGGGTNRSAGPASSGLVVESSSAPEVRGNRVEGGSGTASTGIASIAVILRGGAVTLQDNDIRGGSGVMSGPGIGSIGLVVNGGEALVGPNAIVNNVIDGGTGTASGGYPTIGVHIQSHSPAVDLVADTIVAGAGTCGGTAGDHCGSRGFFSETPRRISIERSRLDGGEISGLGQLGFDAIRIEGSAGAFVANNLIHAGNQAARTAFYGSRAVDVSNASDPSIVSNTTYAGVAPTSQSFGVVLHTNAQRAVVTSNLLLGSGQNDYGLYFEACSGSSLKAAENNAFIGFGGGVAWTYKTATSGCENANSHTTLVTAEAALGSVAKNNVRIANECMSDDLSRCKVVSSCTSAALCLPSILDAWDGPSAGRKELSARGWRLKTGGACLLLKGGVSFPGVTVDHFNVARTVPPSIGAHENDGACL